MVSAPDRDDRKLHSTASYDFEPAIMARLRELRPDLEYVGAENAGHNVHRDKPEVVNAAINRFLGS